MGQGPTSASAARADAADTPPGDLDPGVGPILPRTRNGRWLVVAVLALAFLARGAIVLATRDYVPVNDAKAYDRVASSLADADGYPENLMLLAEGPSAFRAPGYPASLALVYAVAGNHSWTWGRLANAALGTAEVALIGLIGTSLFGRRVGVAALLLAAAHPTLMLHSSGLQLEPLLVTLELGSLAAVLEHRRSPRGPTWLVLAGVLLGAAVLTREVALSLLPILVLLLLRSHARPRWTLRGLRAAALVTATVVVVVLPWTIRNAVELDALVPVTSDSGYALAGTYNATSMNNAEDPAIWIGPHQDPHLYEVMIKLDNRSELSLDHALRSESLQFIRDHPSYVGKTVFWNTVRMFDLQGPNDALFIAQFLPYSPALTRAAVYASYIVYALALASVFAPAMRRSQRLVWLFPLVTWLGYTLISANIRYRAAIEPFLVLAAAVTLVWIADRFGPHRRRQGTATPGGLAGG